MKALNFTLNCWLTDSINNRGRGWLLRWEGWIANITSTFCRKKIKVGERRWLWKQCKNERPPGKPKDSTKTPLYTLLSRFFVHTKTGAMHLFIKIKGIFGKKTFLSIFSLWKCTYTLHTVAKKLTFSYLGNWTNWPNFINILVRCCLLKILSIFFKHFSNL